MAASVRKALRLLATPCLTKASMRVLTILGRVTLNFSVEFREEMELILKQAEVLSNAWVG